MYGGYGPFRELQNCSIGKQKVTNTNLNKVVCRKLHHRVWLMTNDLALVRRVWLTKMRLCCCAGDDANVLVDLLKVTTLLLTS